MTFSGIVPWEILMPLAFMRLVLLAVVFGASGAGAEEAHVLGPYAEACGAGTEGPAVLVHVTGFKDRAGNLRVELYPAVEGEFLAPRARLQVEGKIFQRIDVPMPQSGDAEVCVPVPATGPYAMAVLHDRNASGKLDAFNDGFGFPNNPRLGYGKPDAAEATFTAGAGVTRLDIVLNYWNGLAARPLRKRR